MLLSNAAVVTPQGLLEDGWVQIEGESILAIGTGEAPSGEVGRVVDLGGATLVPGFIDLHVHGGGGGTYTDGERSEVARAVAFHRANGTTTTLASLVTAPLPDLLEATAKLAGLAEEGLIAGIHLEGPFLSGRYCGAQDPRHLLAPDTDSLEDLLGAGRAQVRMITVAPELPGALELVSCALDHGVIVAIGHSNARYDEACAAIDAGATVATHLCNGMRPIHQREPGIVGAALEHERVVCELIADGYHLHPAILRLAFATAGERVALVTDAISAAGAPDGRYRLGPQWVDVEHGEAHLSGTRTIAGSTTTCAKAFRHAVLEAGLDLCDVARSASLVPARLLGLDGALGTIEAGKVANLVVLDAGLGVEAVVERGAWRAAADELEPAD